MISDAKFKLIASNLADDADLVVVNPATGEKIASVITYTTEQISEIILHAEDVRKIWARLTAKCRGDRLRAWAAKILEHRDTLATLCTMESGKPLCESVAEVSYAASFIEWFAEEGRRAYGETIPSFAEGKSVMTFRVPVGSCAAITPWNFPLAMITRKVGPALAAGCSMVVKPSEATPLSALALEALANDADIPAGLFRVVPTTDPGSVGKLFCNHPLIRKISFTGSTAVGKLLLAQAAGTVKRVSMELGGNAPFIVFDDADVDDAIEGLLASKFRNAGQACIAANRVLVQDAVHEEFVAKFVARVRTLAVGNGSAMGSQVGPLINARAVAKVQALVRSALDAGARLECGGDLHEEGELFFWPTVVTAVDPHMEIATSEIFGPIAPIIRFSNEDEAIRISNDTPYGLAAYLYSRDIGRIFRVTNALEYGMVAVNEGRLSTEIAPFGGVKESGLGREGARQGLDEYLEIKYALMGGVSL